MSKFASLTKGGMGAASTIGQGMGKASSAVQSSSAYQGAVKNASKEFNISLNYGQIGIIFILSVLYLIIASIGIDMYSKCKELEGNKVQENLNKWLIATLAISITIPFTLILTKISGSKLTPVLMIIFAIMGIIGSSTSLNWSMKCEGVDTADKSKQIYSGLNIASFVCMCLIAMFLMRPKSM